MELIEQIKADIAEREPNMAPTDDGYRDQVICMLLATCDLPELSKDLRAGLIAATGYSEEFVGAILANLEASRAFTSDGFIDTLQEGLSGKDSGITLCLLTNLALGLMEYFPKDDTMKLTPAGKLYVEQKVLKRATSVMTNKIPAKQRRKYRAAK